MVECGFLTNPVEAQLALTPEYREQVAEQIAAGIIEQRQFSFPPRVPNHQGRLVHKTKKHRKVVHSERLVYPCASIPRDRANIDVGSTCFPMRCHLLGYADCEPNAITRPIESRN